MRFLNYLLALLLSTSFISICAQDTPVEVVSNIVLDVKNFVYNPANGEITEWENAPVKIISFPLTKLQYEVLPEITSLFTESFTRSPWHNLLGTLYEANNTMVTLGNGLKDLARGIANPTKAGVVDGILEIGTAPLTLIRPASGLVKTCTSTVCYPAYNLISNKKSKFAPVTGKRASIVFVDTGFYPYDIFLDPYGEQIVRYHLKGISNYYCAIMNFEGDIKDCIRKMPKDIEYVDMVALTHSGGTTKMEYWMKEIMSQKKSVKPGLMLSIGCGDDPSLMTEAENAMGQQGYSWAVHFYLSSAIAKRLRGMPMEQAALEAFHENKGINFLNPVSIGGMYVVDGLEGSTPRTRQSEK
jgi:hypothetical protein